MFNFRMGVALLLGAIYMLIMGVLMFSMSGVGVLLFFASIVLAVTGFVLAVKGALDAPKDKDEE